MRAVRLAAVPMLAWVASATAGIGPPIELPQAGPGIVRDKIAVVASGNGFAAAGFFGYRKFQPDGTAIAQPQDQRSPDYFNDHRPAIASNGDVDLVVNPQLFVNVDAYRGGKRINSTTFVGTENDVAVRFTASTATGRTSARESCGSSRRPPREPAGPEPRHRQRDGSSRKMRRECCARSGSPWRPCWLRFPSQ